MGCLENWVGRIQTKNAATSASPVHQFLGSSLKSALADWLVSVLSPLKRT